MRILISSVGTRGDVQPAIALAIQIRALGQQVRLCVPPNFTQWAGRLGFEARPIGIEMRAPRPGEKPAVIPDLITDQFEVIAAASEDCDLILGATAHQYAAPSIAELRRVPYVDAVYAPVSLPSAELSPSGFTDEAQSPDANLERWQIHRKVWNDRALERVNANRGKLGLAAIDDVLGHVLTDRPWLAADPILGPAPSTPGMTVFQTGAWILPDASALPAALEDFLNRGEPPVYLGFGSMPAAETIAATLIGAVRSIGRRAILSQGWAGLGLADNQADCISIGDVSHEKLFPRVAAVVHHGGAGTTTAAALAGTPQLVTPMFADQYYWARRACDLGIGTAIPHAKLEAQALADCLRKALEPGVSDQARSLSSRIVADGAAVAARRLVQGVP